MKVQGNRYINNPEMIKNKVEKKTTVPQNIIAEYKCENLFKLDLKAASISGEQSAFEGCSENQSEVFEKWLDENAS